jgi:hypothetical protein
MDDDEPSEDRDNALDEQVEPARDVTGGFPAVHLEPGLLILTNSEAALNAIDEADGPNAHLMALLDGAQDAWGFAAALDPISTTDPEAVGEVTSYPATTDYGGAIEDLVFSTLPDTSPFTSC